MRWFWLAAIGLVAGAALAQIRPGGVRIVRAAPTPMPAAHDALPTAREIPNFAVVAPGIYRGAAPTAAGMRRLKALGVRTIIDLRIENKGQSDEAALAQSLGMERVRIRLGREAPSPSQVAQYLALLANPAKGPVFVHCQHGADRTGAMIGIWRVSRQGWTFPQAWTEMRKYGFKPFLLELKGAVESRAKGSDARPAPRQKPPPTSR